MYYLIKYFVVDDFICNFPFLQKKTKIQLTSVQSLSHVQLFVTPWTAARQGSLSFTNSWSLLKLMSIELVTPTNHLLSSPSPAFNLFQQEGIFQ